MHVNKCFLYIEMFRIFNIYSHFNEIYKPTQWESKDQQSLNFEQKQKTGVYSSSFPKWHSQTPSRDTTGKEACMQDGVMR